MTLDDVMATLPDCPAWRSAAAACHQWLTENMGFFGPERILRFMQHQPVRAARDILEKCDNPTDESVTVVLLGPAKGDVLENQQTEEAGAGFYGARAVALIRALRDGYAKAPSHLQLDVARIYMVEALSDMYDQIIGRAKIDAHHDVRWNMLREFEDEFGVLKGLNPGLDTIFADALAQSRQSLEALDAQKASGMGA